MRILSFLIILLTLLSSCRSYDLSMLETPNEPLSPKLLTLEKRLEDMANATVKTSDAELKIFTKEVEENLLDPYGEKYGYIALKRTILEKKTGWIWYGPFLASIGLSTALGIPVDNRRYKVEAELRVYDRTNRLLGKYSGIGEGKAWVALYWGYDYIDVETKAFSEALLEAFDEVRPKIQADVNRLNSLLKEKGKF